MCEKRWEGSHLFQWLLDESAVSPLGQDDGLHVFPVQAAALGSVEGQLGRRVVVLRGEAELQLIYIHKEVCITRKRSTKASTKLVAYFPLIKEPNLVSQRYCPSFCY